MLDNDIIQSTSSWPFVEVRKLLKDRKDLIKKKIELLSKQDMAQAGYPTLVLSAKWHVPQ